MTHNPMFSTPAVTQDERQILERLLKRGGATLVLDGDALITTYFNTGRVRDQGIRHG